MNVRKWGGYWAQTAGVLAIVVSIVNLVAYFEVITLTNEMLAIFLVGFIGSVICGVAITILGVIVVKRPSKVAGISIIIFAVVGLFFGGTAVRWFMVVAIISGFFSFSKTVY